jgi:hypothetical protein
MLLKIQEEVNLNREIRDKWYELSKQLLQNILDNKNISRRAWETTLKGFSLWHSHILKNRHKFKLSYCDVFETKIIIDIEDAVLFLFEETIKIIHTKRV